jgi:hypothetical protein
MRPERLDTARVFERVFAIYRLQARVLLPAALLIYIVPSALILSSNVTLQALALAAFLVGAVVYEGLVVQAVRDIQDGVRDLSFLGLFRSISTVLAPLMWTAIIVGVGVFLGFLAFIIPGLVLLTQWAVAAPVVVCEVRSAPEAIGRSRTLVHGHGWRVFGVLVATLLLVFVASSTVIALGSSGGQAVIALASLIARTLTAPVFGLASAVLYLELLQLKGEQLPPADMASFSGRGPRA